MKIICISKLVSAAVYSSKLERNYGRIIISNLISFVVFLPFPKKDHNKCRQESLCSSGSHWERHNDLVIKILCVTSGAVLLVECLDAEGVREGYERAVKLRMPRANAKFHWP